MIPGGSWDRTEEKMEGADPKAAEAKQVSSRELAVSLESLYSRGVLLGLAQVLAPAAVPVYDYLEAYSKDDRLYPYTFVFIGGNVLVGLIGMLASTQRRSSLLALHVAAAVIVGCVVGGLSLLLSHVMWIHCEIKSKSFEGCNELTCGCLLDDSCTDSDFDNNIGCSACKAFSNDICSYFDYDGVTRGFNPETYKVVVIVCMNVLSAAHSLLVLVRKEHFDSIQSSRREIIFDHIRTKDLSAAKVYAAGPPGHQPLAPRQPARNPQESIARPQAGGQKKKKEEGAETAKEGPPEDKALAAKGKKEKKRKKAKSKKISPVTSFENGGGGGGEVGAAPQTNANTNGGVFDLGPDSEKVTMRDNKMIEQTEYDRLRKSVAKDQRQGKKKSPPQAAVETDLGIEDVDDFLENLM